MTEQNPRFELGHVVSTIGALEALRAAEQDPNTLLTRHASGDFGDIEDADKRANEIAIEQEERIISAYILPKTEVTIWVITERDRSATTLLLPGEY